MAKTPPIRPDRSAEEVAADLDRYVDHALTLGATRAKANAPRAPA